MSSKQTLLEFLERLHAELSKKSKDYRSIHSNKKAHKFSLSKAIVYKETLIQLNKMGFTELSSEDLGVVRAISDATYTKISRLFQDLRKWEEAWISIPETRFTSANFVIVFYEDAKDDIFVKRIRDQYAVVTDEYALELKGYFMRKRSNATKQGRDKFRNIKSGGQVLNLGHSPESAVFEAGLNYALGKVLKDMSLESIDFKHLGTNTDFMVRYFALMGQKSDTVNVSLESALDNYSRGGRIGVEKQKIKAGLELAIRKLRSEIYFVSGSDSLYTSKRKKTIKAITDPFKTVKGAKVKTENTKINKSRGAVTLEKASKTKRAKYPITLRDPTTGRFISKEQAQSPTNLLAILNAKLPDVVAANMQWPRLRYRTGRFAQSVKAVDIQQTPKGMPSIGYTYMKYPYQTFEPGYAQGTEERDPRSLIDKSIRDIAIGLIQERFYTRRV